MIKKSFQVINPADQSIYLERSYATESEIEEAIQQARNAQRSWKNTPIPERARICQKAIDYLISNADQIGEEITKQMGRPIRYTPSELTSGLRERAEYMIAIAEDSLRNIDLDSKRYIKREPLGTVLVLAPWNYPFLTSVNAIIPALMAGNTVILKHSDQTPLTAERYAKAFQHADLPKGVFTYLHMTHEQVASVIPKMDYTAFTGSVAGGKAVEKAGAGHFMGLGLELGGKDAAYVRADSNLAHAAENLVDGAFFNSGQSCCGIERIYVHESVYDHFLESYVSLTKRYILDDPMNSETEIGPMVSTKAAQRIKEVTQDAIQQGAKAHINKQKENREAYLYPEVLTNVTHEMRLMKEETFGPVVGIMKVANDEEAMRLMNDSDYGLTASVWTTDLERAAEIGNELEVGTVFANRCDYLDPALAWTGVKNSGRGSTLSSLGYVSLTRPKSFHLKEI